MKKIFFITMTILLVSAFTKAQHHYIPIPDTNVEWIYGINGNCPPINICGYFYIKIEGDTIIGNYTYKKIMSTPLNGSIYSYDAAIRQDTFEKKIYVINGNYQSCSNIDTLLYDFNLQQGDTLKQCIDILGGGNPFTILSVDSVFIAGSWRKRINLNMMTVPSLIEGLGSTAGFFGPWNGWIGSDIFLECFSINGVPVYPDTLCSLVGINSNNLSKIDVEVFPNPTSYRSSIYINLPYPASCKINIYNLTSCHSENIYTGKLDSGIRYIEFNALNFSSGLYVLQIFYDSNEFNKLIVIIN